MIIATIIIADVVSISLSFVTDDIAIEKSSLDMRSDDLLNIPADK